MCEYAAIHSFTIKISGRLFCDCFLQQNRTLHIYAICFSDFYAMLGASSLVWVYAVSFWHSFHLDFAVGEILWSHLRAQIVYRHTYDMNDFGCLAATTGDSLFVLSYTMENIEWNYYIVYYFFYVFQSISILQKGKTLASNNGKKIRIRILRQFAISHNSKQITKNTPFNKE